MSKGRMTTHPHLNQHERVTYDAERGTYQTVHDWHSDESLSTTVAMAVSTVVEPTETDCVLYDAIDPDALCDFLRPLADGTVRPEARVTFQWAGFEVVVEGGGAIELWPQ